MKGKSIALLVLALGCGLVASLGITQVMAKRGEPAAAVDTAPVYVAKVEIADGLLVTADNVMLEHWPKDRIPAGAVGRPEDIDGRRTRQRIFAGEPIIEPKLLAHGQTLTDTTIPKGMRAVPVAVEIEAINGGLVLPGSRCDLQVFIRADPNLGVSETVCKTILQDVRVFAVNDQTSTESADPKAPRTTSIPTGRTVSLLVTPAQAQTVTLASQLGKIKLILRSGDDKEQVKVPDMTFREVMGGGQSGSNRPRENPADAEALRFREWAEMIKKTLAQKAKTVPAATPAVPEPERFTMRIRSGAEVNDVLLIANSAVPDLPGDEGIWSATGLGPLSHARATAEPHIVRPTDTGPQASPAGPAVAPKSGPVTLPAVPGFTPPKGA